MENYEVKNMSTSTDIKKFEHGTVELINVAGKTVRRYALRKGWRWSTDVKPMAKTEWCEASHFQYVVSGRYHIKLKDGTEFEIGPGDVASIPPGHDAWVVGEEPLVGIELSSPTTATK